jgi:hypothetical protein
MGVFLRFQVKGFVIGMGKASIWAVSAGGEQQP